MLREGRGQEGNLATLGKATPGQGRGGAGWAGARRESSACRGRVGSRPPAQPPPPSLNGSGLRGDDPGAFSRGERRILDALSSVLRRRPLRLNRRRRRTHCGWPRCLGAWRSVSHRPGAAKTLWAGSPRRARGEPRAGEAAVLAVTTGERSQAQRAARR